MSSSSSSSSKPPPAHLLQITTTTSSSVTQSSSRSPRAAGGGGAQQNQACAACKYQRRKCNPDCPLARYFPADQQRRFLNAHRLFGVSNIQKTLRDTDPELRPDAMRALIFQAEARAYDPVGGCCRMAFDLQRQLDLGKAELAAVLSHLALCRQQAAAIANDALVDPGMLLATGDAPDHDDVVVDALYADHETTGQVSGVQDHYALSDQMQPQPHQLYDYFYYDGTAGDDTSSHAWSNVDNMQQQQQYGNGGAGVKAGSPVALSEQLEQHCQIETQFVDVFDMKPEITTTMEHRGNASLEHLEGKVSTVVKNEVDHHATQMVESSAASHCQLELGFSSF